MAMRLSAEQQAMLDGKNGALKAGYPVMWKDKSAKTWLRESVKILL